jgi:KaiC/GvpD/RAD55 family RecA-like ATPase
MPKTPKGFHLPPFVMAPEDLEEVALHIEKKLAVGCEDIFWPIPTGFDPIDHYSGGGLHAGDLTIIGGVQNVGKTALVLQIANHISVNDALAIIVCYEHSTITLWERLLCQNSFLVDPDEHITMDSLREAYIETIRERNRILAGQSTQKIHMLDEVLSRVPRGTESWSKLSDRMRNIWLVMGDGVNTDLVSLNQYIEIAIQHYHKHRVVLIIDYVQRVPIIDTSRALNSDERIERVLTGLKGMAMRITSQGYVLSIVAVGAADVDGIRQGRVHFENLWGNSIMQYEPDIALIGNRDGVDTNGVALVRWAIEKNRRGQSNIEFTHRYHGAAFSFERSGERIGCEESWQSEREGCRKP